jgi:hypothetical protein
MLASYLGEAAAADEDKPAAAPSDMVTITIDRALAENFAKALAESIREKSE